MDSISALIEALRCLPGVGPKSAQRMVYHLLKHQRHRGLHLATALERAMNSVVHCSSCHNFSDTPICSLCQNTTRDTTLLCVVDSPSNIQAIEQTLAFKGKYFVLMGKISPLEGLGPEEIGLPKLKMLIEQHHIQEVIMALTPSIEGQTTIHFIREMIKNHSVRISQLAQGIPTGGELEYLDGRTILNALNNRALLTESI